MTPIDPRSALFQELHSHLGWWSPRQATYSLFPHSRVPLVLPLLFSVDSDSDPTRETHRIKSLRSDSLSLTPPLHWSKTSWILNREFQSELLVWNQLESAPRMTPRLKSQHHSAGPQLARWGNSHQRTKHLPNKGEIRYPHQKPPQMSQLQMSSSKDRTTNKNNKSSMHSSENSHCNIPWENQFCWSASQGQQLWICSQALKRISIAA